jgi:hypothetical protein
MKKSTYSISELNAVFTLLGKCKNDKDLNNPSSMLSIIRVVKKIEEAIKSYSEEQKQILENFDVPQIEKEQGAMYDWSNMKPEIQSKIQDLLKELNGTQYEIKGFNNVDEEDFVIFTKGLETQAIAFLWDYLVKE